MSERERGAEFLLHEVDANDVFTPEDFSDEQKQIQDTTRELVEGEILPKITEIDKPNFALSRELMLKAGELGLLMIDGPEAQGGLELDKATSLLAAEELARTGSFSVTYTAHTGIGVLPLTYYGTEEQKERYLPKLMSGEWIASYCLTEPDSGSDALTVSTTAVAEGDNYILNGTKQFITNGGFADFFTVFAAVEKDKLTAFLVERTYPGVSTGPEEHKMGIKGSSTTQVIFENVKVPKNNILGEVGEGHKIAFNILDIGRLKLGACVNGAARQVIKDAIAYAKQRKQFGTEICNFGAIQEKFADTVARLYASESLVYRCAGRIDEGHAPLDKKSPDYRKQYLKIIAEYAPECSIAKVFCSEMLGEAVDKMLQVYGGYGYVTEYPAERAYRDERINRIYEGTNEINRLLIPADILKKSMKGELPLQKAAMEAMNDLMNPSFDLPDESQLFAKEKALVANMKKVFLILSGAAAQKFGLKLQNEEEVLLAAADVAAEIYAAESAILRAIKNHPKSSDKKKALYEALVTVVCFESSERLAYAARKAAYGVEEGDTLLAILSGIRRYTKYNAQGLIAAKRLIAREVTESGRYVFERA